MAFVAGSYSRVKSKITLSVRTAWWRILILSSLVVLVTYESPVSG